jgi:hypothetical protein
LTEKQNEESENDNNQEVDFLEVNLKQNVKIMVLLRIKRRISTLCSTKMAVRTAEITTIFRKIREMALLTVWLIF